MSKRIVVIHVKQMLFISLCFIMIMVCSCNQEPVILEPLLSVPSGFPSPAFPPDNELTRERWELGKRLFFDPVMSLDSSISCASCHQPAYAFSDNRSLSPGIENRIGTRNAPSLGNVAYHPYYTREGGVPTLEMQILVPVQEHAEFDCNILVIADRLGKNKSYVSMSLAAYDRLPDPFVITRSIAVFERTLITGDSKFDEYSKGARFALNTVEKAGMELFFSDQLNCAKCHSGFNFTDYSFQNNGLYEDYADPGRFRLTNNEDDRALFKVPSLRNVGVTAPYMHDGTMPTLESVIDHYDSGGKSHPHKNPLIVPLHLSPKEKRALVAFLNTLTDLHFISNPKFLP